LKLEDRYAEPALWSRSEQVAHKLVVDTELDPIPGLEVDSRHGRVAQQFRGVEEVLMQVKPEPSLRHRVPRVPGDHRLFRGNQWVFDARNNGHTPAYSGKKQGEGLVEHSIAQFNRYLVDLLLRPCWEARCEVGKKSMGSIEKRVPGLADLRDMKTKWPATAQRNLDGVGLWQEDDGAATITGIHELLARAGKRDSASDLSRGLVKELADVQAARHVWGFNTEGMRPRNPGPSELDPAREGGGRT